MNSKKARNARKWYEVIVLASEQFEIIKSIITKYKLKNIVSYLCNISGVSFLRKSSSKFNTVLDT